MLIGKSWGTAATYPQPGAAQDLPLQAVDLALRLSHLLRCNDTHQSVRPLLLMPGEIMLMNAAHSRSLSCNPHMLVMLTSHADLVVLGLELRVEVLVVLPSLQHTVQGVEQVLL